MQTFTCWILRLALNDRTAQAAPDNLSCNLRVHLYSMG